MRITRISLRCGLVFALSCAALICQADERDLRPLEMWGGRRAHPAVVNSVTGACAVFVNSTVDLWQEFMSAPSRLR